MMKKIENVVLGRDQKVHKCVRNEHDFIEFFIAAGLIFAKK